MALTDKQLQKALISIAEALESGLSFKNYLDSPATQRALPLTLRKTLSARILEGDTVTEAFSHTNTLSDADLALLDAGERVGRLDTTLRSIAEAISKRRAYRVKVLMGLGYPTLLVNTASCVIPIPLFISSGPGSYLLTAIWIPLISAIGAAFIFLVLPGCRPAQC